MEIELEEWQETCPSESEHSHRLMQEVERFVENVSLNSCAPRAVFVFDFDKTLTLHPLSWQDGTDGVDVDSLRAKFKPYVLEHFGAFVRTQRIRGNLCIILSFCASSIIQRVLRRVFSGLVHGEDLLVIGPDNFENRRGRDVHEESTRHFSKPHRNMKFRFLRSFLHRTSIHPSQVLFFDDRKKHLRSVKTLGVHAIRVYDVHHPAFHPDTDAVHKMLTEFINEHFFDTNDVQRFGNFLRRYVLTTRGIAQSSEEET